MRRMLLVAAVALFVCGGCRRRPAPGEGNYFPMAAGYEWKYSTTEINYRDSVRAETTAGVGSSEFRCIGRRTLPTGRDAWALHHYVLYIDKSEPARAAKDTAMWYTDTIFAERVDSLVLYWRSGDFERPNTELVLPLRPGRSWTVPGAKAYSSRATAVRQEPVKVPAGEYAQAWRVEDSTSYADGKAAPSRIVRWYAAGAGLVRMEMASRRPDGTRWMVVDELVSAKTGKQ